MVGMKIYHKSKESKYAKRIKSIVRKTTRKATKNSGEVF